MADKIRNTNNLEEKLNDYEDVPVPKHVHMSWIDQGAVWVGVGFCLAAISTGGVLANGLGFRDMLIATCIGSLILATIASLIGVIGANTHLSSSMSARFCFGINGSKILGIVCAISLFGWFGFQADLFGSTVVTIIKEVGGPELNQTLFTVLGGLAMMLTAIIGYKGIKLLSTIGVPLLFILSAVALYMSFKTVSFSDIVASGPVGEPMGLALGISAVVGSSAVGVVLVSDFSRYSAKPKDAVLGSILGYIIGYIPVLLLGAIFTYAFQNWNVVEVMISTLGMGVFAAIVLIIAQWTTNDNNLYQSVLGLVNAIRGFSNIKRWKLTMIVGIISTIIAAIGLQKYYLNFLTILTSVIPAVGGILIADYYIINKDGYKYELMDSLPSVNKIAVSSWLLGGLIGLSMTSPPTGFGIKFMVELGNTVPIPIVAMIVSFVCYITLSKIMENRRSMSEIEVAETK